MGKFVQLNRISISFLLMLMASLSVKADVKLSQQQVVKSVERIASLYADEYVYAEVGERVQQQLDMQLQEGEFNHIQSPAELANKLHQSIQQITHDLHVAVRHTPSRKETIKQRAKHDAVFESKQLAEGIGYLKFNQFNGSYSSKRKMKNAMTQLSHNRMLIIDLTENGGGSPEMVAYLGGFFFANPTTLNIFYDRNNTIVGKVKTSPHRLSKQLSKNMQLIILTSNKTFSAAEGFTYHMQAFNKALVVGEKTGGGAHPITIRNIDNDIQVVIPFRRAFNPLTKGNWEGVGVIPDISVPAQNALNKAIELAQSS